MKISYNKSSQIFGLAIVAGLLGIACSSDNGNGGGTTPATGGSTAAVGGSSATGGKTGSATTAPTGGKTGVGGTSAAAPTGGTTTAGGSTAAPTGGTTTAGGSSAKGGTSAVGGTTTAGGSAAVGGTTTAGGSAAVGGTTTAGGSAAVGGTTTAGGTTANGGTTSTSTTQACTAAYSFDGSDTQGWSVPSSETDVTIAQSTTQTKDGTNALQVTLPALTSSAAADAGASAFVSRSLSVSPTAAANLYPGAVVKYNIWVPANGGSLKVQPFSQFNNWNGQDYPNPVALTAGAWKEVDYTIPNTLPGGIQSLGLQFAVQDGGTFAGGAVYVDAVSVCGGTTACTGTGTGSTVFDTAASKDGWSVGGYPTPTDTTIAQSTDQYFGASGGSLLATLTAIPVAASATSPTCRQIQFGGQGNKSTFTLSCGQTVTFHVYSADATNLLVQPFSSQNNWSFAAGTSSTLTASTWTTLTYAIPSTIGSLGLQAVGLQLCNTSTTATYTGSVYIDSVSW